jgi:hypothetical protein
VGKVADDGRCNLSSHGDPALPLQPAF